MCLRNCTEWQPEKNLVDLKNRGVTALKKISREGKTAFTLSAAAMVKLGFCPSLRQKI